MIEKILLILVLIMLLTTQLTQSHFAHHQAISFFITTLFVLVIISKLKLECMASSSFRSQLITKNININIIITNNIASF